MTNTLDIALYAPMKPLDDPTPSGDRQIGRFIAAALGRIGHHVVQPTRFRSWDRDGGVARQQEIERAARQEADRLLADYRDGAAARPDIWLTYHLYHKAPDWIGPVVADALAIPYLVIEASRALKRKTGPWSHGFAAADMALRRADIVAAMHAHDAGNLAPFVPAETLRILPPFIDVSAYEPRQTRTPNDPLRLLTVAMMRDGDKMRSYRLLAEALALVADCEWHLTIIGDGPMRKDVLALFPDDRISWLGRIAPEDIPQHYAQVDLFVWPAIREAFGLVFLEAQAAGVPVIAGHNLGVPDIVRDGETGWLVPIEDAGAFAGALRQALSDRSALAKKGSAARVFVQRGHDIAPASKALEALLQQAIKNNRKRTAVS